MAYNDRPRSEDRGQDDYGYGYRSRGQGAQGQDRYGARGETRYGGYEGGRGAQDYRGQQSDDDRGFFDRAGDEVRSWFGDDEAQRRREQDNRYGEQERDRGGYQTYGDRSFGNRERHDYDRERQNYGQTYGQQQGGKSRYTQSYGGGSRETQDRYGASGQPSAYGQGQQGHSSYSNYQSRQDNDVHGYGDWRRRQIEELDRDYDEYRRENQSQFDSQFATWRGKRQGQRQSLGKVTEHQEVVGSDGQHIGTVDKVRGDRIILTKNDQDAGGRHHSIPCSWIESVDEKITVNKTHDEAQRQWRDEEQRGALFGDDDQGQGQRMTGSYAGSNTRNY